ncbi:MAG: twin-arginine translocase subunit TatC [Candidatus Marinimicrobia bacterium]|jgi:sec-independent protein translocase protein TatC|nr:twin-arginine translocase subunit TatC [Candidatus Neomarinimicrobiota bacterium]MBT3574776.1 twin-arginine translocase subunit TatC [Candidatus Neomarinimicrobiota bacterium]MBT3681162.1 twin-arginine translocase subunit TatC [Candidatus Neomarinimicrobiota bacterium]MBT3950155.1 twin-arginine translocase subunit TatC [Candidatus Neomarinimicrobiota bacterium]MBT4254115.1 twin-arginine translocase subunit TatC [Candidatus Neomarinimicrobiota bacterium]
MSKVSNTEMPLLDHLEELRWRVIKAFSSILLFAVIGFIFSNQLIYILSIPIENTEPKLDLLNTTILGVFLAKMRVAVVLGIVFSLPVIIHQVWKFIAPGLLDDERSFAPMLIITTIVSFVIGGLFSYFVMIPWSLKFFAVLNYGLEGLVNYVTITDYLNYITILILFTGMAFELPVVVFILAKIGIVTPNILRKVRRFAYLGILMVSAIFTPADPFTMVGVAMPMVLLYEVSIFVAKLVKQKKQEKAEMEEVESEGINKEDELLEDFLG